MVFLHGLAGDADTSIDHLQTSLRRGPRARVGTSIFLLGAALFVSRRFEEAVSKLLLPIHEDPTNPAPHRFLAACYAHMDRRDEARQQVQQLRALTPVLITNTDHIRNPEHRELFVSSMRLAADEA